MSQKKLTKKGESFAQAYIAHDGELIKAYRNSEYSQNLTAAQMSVEASKLYKSPIISLRIKELQSKVNIIAEKKFTVSIEQRLKWLSDIVGMGMSDYPDAQGNPRKENLAAAKGAIETLNTMLGIDEQSGVVKPVKVFIGVEDASKS